MMRVTYLGHSGFFLELEDAQFLFDYNTGGLPKIDPEKKLFVFVSHRHHDHYNPEILNLKRKGLTNRIWYLFSEDVPVPDDQEQVIRLAAEEEKTVEGVRVRALPSTDEGVAFWIEYHGKVIYHAGDLNWWHWEGESESYNTQMKVDYQKSIGTLPAQPIHVAFVPADLRLGEQYVWGLDYFMRHTDTMQVFPMHFWGEYEVFDRLIQEPCTAEYRSRIQMIQKEGQMFDIQSQT